MLRALGLAAVTAMLLSGCEDQSHTQADDRPNPLAQVPREELYNALRTAEPGWNPWCVEYYQDPDAQAKLGNSEFCLHDMPKLLVRELYRQGYEATMEHVKERWLWEFMDQRMQPIWECQRIERRKPIGQGDEQACDPWMQARLQQPFKGN